MNSPTEKRGSIRASVTCIFDLPDDQSKMRLVPRLRKANQLHNGRYTPLGADSSPH
jgi:hypothetical protein